MGDYAMDCILWASKVARTPDDELPRPMPGSAAMPNEVDEGEKDRVKTMNLEDSESDQEASVEEGQLAVEDNDDISEGEDNQVNSDAESTSSDGWESTLEKTSELRISAAMQQPKTKATGVHCSWSDACHKGERN